MILKEVEGQILTADITRCRSCPADGRCSVSQLTGRIGISKNMPGLSEIERLAKESGLIYKTGAYHLVDGVPSSEFGTRLYECSGGNGGYGHGQIELDLNKAPQESNTVS